MIGRFRSPSLFWTFTGSFLVVLAVAAAMQVFLAVAVLGPWSRRWAADRAELALRSASTELAVLPGPVGDRDVARVLRAHRGEARGTAIMFLCEDGRTISDRGRTFQRGGSRGGAPGDSLVPTDADRTRSPRSGTRRSPGRPPHAIAKLHLSAPNGLVGDLVAYSPSRPVPFGPGLPPGAFVILLPVAIVIAGGAGLVLFRAAVGRLRELELLAARVTDGDYDARVRDPGADEIGRLGRRLNTMTARLAAQRHEVAEADRQRTQLFADISHELATPLTSVRGYAETLVDPNVQTSEEERQTYLRDLLGEARRMDDLIQDIFELARLEGGTMPLHRERLDVDALARNVAARYLPRFRDAGITLEVGGTPQPAVALADGRRVEQALSNLLGNALRYVPRGGQVIVTVQRGGAVDAPVVLMSVADDGPGIPADALPHVFERFYRADSSRSEGGAGLGLAIVQEIVRQHGGRTRAENVTPHGARLTLEFPAAS